MKHTAIFIKPGKKQSHLVAWNDKGKADVALLDNWNLIEELKLRLRAVQPATKTKRRRARK